MIYFLIVSDSEIRDLCIDYLVNSGFVEAYVKKLMYPSDIDNLYEDFTQETWLAILEVPEQKIVNLYLNSINDGDSDAFYQLRNWISRLIYNTVHSDSSNAYKKLKKHNVSEKIQTEVQWDVYKASIPDERTIIDQIRNNE